MGHTKNTCAYRLALLAPALLAPKLVSAHCPLCTIGAAAAAGGAAYVGVSNFVVGIFIGAFAVSMGWWIARMLSKKYVRYQRELLIISSFLLTIIPIIPIMNQNFPVYLSIMGEYGSLLNRTYILNLFLAGSVAGGAIVCVSPWISRKITDARGKTVPFQGTVLTLVALTIVALAFEMIL